MKIVFKNIALVFSFAFLAACDPSKMNEITATQPLSSYPKENGIISGSFVAGKTMAKFPFQDPKLVDPYSSKTLYFKNIKDPEKTYSIGLSLSMMGETMGKYLKNGELFVYSLPPGEYSFYDFNFFENAGTYSKNFGAKEEFNIPFSVKSNEVAYLGEIKSVPRFGKNVFGLTITTGGHFEISDKSNRDKKALIKKHSEIDWSNLKNKTLKKGVNTGNSMKFQNHMSF